MRPKIICHMMSSVDGKLLTSRYTPPFDGKTIDEVVDSYFDISSELKGDAILIGRTTVQEFSLPQSFENKGYKPTNNPVNFKGNLSRKNTVVLIDPKGKILYEGEYSQTDNYITILSEQVSDEYLDHLRERGISYIFAGTEGNDLVRAVNVLCEEFGIETLLVEGGGFVNGAFLNAGLIDELSLMIYPGIDGLSGIPSIFEYKGQPDGKPAAGQSLELSDMKMLDDGIVWLYYRIHKN